MSRLSDKYKEEIVPQLKEELGAKNILALPRLGKVVINVGMVDAKDNQAELDKVVSNLTGLSGQKALVTKAKKSISGFKLVQGQVVGVTVTLRGDRMYEFLDKLMNIVLPKVRDFRGIEPSFDNQGNLTLGLKEQAIFPEVSFQGGSGVKMRGLEISVVTTAKDKEQGRKLLELLGMPFKKEAHK